MKKLLFALYDMTGYMKALAEYFGKKSFILESRLFTKQESLTQFLEKHRPDVLLLGQEVEVQRIRYLENAASVIILTEGNAVEENASRFPVIFKYQSAEKILREIFQYLEETDKVAPAVLGDLRGNTEFIGMYRPYGEPISLQEVFGVKGDGERKGLLINMELLNSMAEEGMEPGRTRGLSEVIFYLKQRSGKLSARLREVVCSREGFDYVYPAQDYRDLYSMTRDDIDCLLAVLSAETDYSRIVFDVGFLNDSALYLLYCCEKIYMPHAGNIWEENQKNAFEQLLVREGLGDLLGNICYVSG